MFHLQAISGQFTSQIRSFPCAAGVINGSQPTHPLMSPGRTSSGRPVSERKRFYLGGSRFQKRNFKKTRDGPK